MSDVGGRWYDDSANGTFMCCICFEQVKHENAWKCSHGNRWDTCGDCGEKNGCTALNCEDKPDD